jgi:hypothetical protein
LYQSLNIFTFINFDNILFFQDKIFEFLSSINQINKLQMKRKQRERSEYEPLNKYKEGEYEHERDLTKDYSGISKSGDTEIIFRNINTRLIKEIKGLPKNHVVFGCVAWFTDFNILRALKGKSYGIVLQKEEFLRPDKVIRTVQGRFNWNKTLRKLYDEAVNPNIPNPEDHLLKFDFKSTLNDLYWYNCRGFGDFRCIGYIPKNKEEKSSIPRMHNKFLIFAEMKIVQDSPGSGLFPYKVWTGSYNMSGNASNSLENVVIMTDEKVVQYYCQEWANLYVNSEKLDWESEYFYPDEDFRIGS